jgi:hypothetical protein
LALRARSWIARQSLSLMVSGGFLLNSPISFLLAGDGIPGLSGDRYGQVQVQAGQRDQVAQAALCSRLEYIVNDPGQPLGFLAVL